MTRGKVRTLIRRRIKKPSLALVVLFTQEPVYKFYSTVFGTTVVKPGELTGLVYAIELGSERCLSSTA